MPHLLLQITSATTQRTISLNEVPVVTIGRSPDNVLPLTDDRASRHHCVIQEQDGHVTVTDLRSRNGIYLNGQRVMAGALRIGDKLKVGGIQIELVVKSDAPIAPAGRRRKPAGWGPEDDDEDKVLPMPPLDVSALLELERPAGSTPAPLIRPGPGEGRRSTPLPSREGKGEGSASRRRARSASSAPAPAPGQGQGEGLRRGPNLGTPAPGVSAPGAPGGAVTPGEADEEYSPEVAVRHEAALRKLLEKLPDSSISDSGLALVNTRGQIAQSVDQRKKDDAEKGPVTILRLLLALCTRARASDLHIEPRADHNQVRMRVDGMMVDIVRLHGGVARRVGNVVKVLCDLDIARNNVVQEGRFSSRIGRRNTEHRVSFAPSVYGQTLAVRVLDHTHTPQRLGDLGMPPPMTQSIQRMVRQDSGMLITCGPTGSGKSTTLYAVVREIDTSSRKIITIEDPPEFQIDGATQMGVNEQQGNTFPALLRSVLRQDPDVIYVGEIRDAETAQMALRAAMTGHLVLTTVHARDARGSIYRLLDLGIEPPLLAQALNLVLSQRLVRKLCDGCKAAGPIRAELAAAGGKALEGVAKVFHAKGCPRCMQTGYAGRLGIFELLQATEEVRDLILRSPTTAQLRAALAHTAHSSLRDSAFQLVARGQTSPDEVSRVLGVE